MTRNFKKPPSRLGKEEFLAIHGRIYEHSPWIAERLWANGIGPTYDTIEGLHLAMAAIVDQAPRDRRLALLNAHPDLAGKLALGGELTAESTGEQASAGLDKCSPQEFARFTILNQTYRARFGFPFIMAVKGRSRAEILEAFERRVENDPETEFKAAMAEVHRIALSRIGDL